METLILLWQAAFSRMADILDIGKHTCNAQYTQLQVVKRIQAERSLVVCLTGLRSTMGDMLRQIVSPVHILDDANNAFLLVSAGSICMSRLFFSLTSKHSLVYHAS